MRYTGSHFLERLDRDDGLNRGFFDGQVFHLRNYFQIEKGLSGLTVATLTGVLYLK
jgi:hypothetical protein